MPLQITIFRKEHQVDFMENFKMSDETQQTKGYYSGSLFIFVNLLTYSTSIDSYRVLTMS